MLDFIKYVLNELGLDEHAEPTRTSVMKYHFRSRDEEIHVNFDLIIDDTYLELTEEDEKAFREFRSKQIFGEKLENLESSINKAVKLYMAKAELTKGNQQGSTFRLTIDLKLEEV
ncbi:MULTISPECIES: hypothetical protein [Pseudoalteromonas]|uniref:hypothetical protein n=1 Tax=Pseudoalteromonas TaxID=53246 RepID=UPI0002CBA842|nr:MULTISPECIES: hypothetical protein [Pseudoalteromonas]WMT83672.1 hypothetical protein PHIACA1_220 [Pseudoalteromonas phage ACA1]WMT83724.1 hypothetical protein PHIACA2_220 [Pseudoalteromonas phage ACA2]WMT83776.1 hypothetical protein PROACA1A_220 [Pseudoalteromonas phage proACA1-A]ENN97179.1 hypothetical protein J139_18751 [Pseudoalteromonas agarivorans S816]WMS91372.1 hypothetical protein RB214_02850 [Pseudoalteromonas sp. HL-AS1]